MKRATAKKREMIQDVSYNGWSNHSTWCVNLWLENDEGSYRYWRDMARECLRLDREDKAGAASGLASNMKIELTENMPDLGATVWADLLQSSFSDVDWYEIAKSWIDGL